MKIMITGGSGLVATELSYLLLSNTDYEIILVSRNKAKVDENYRSYSNRVRCYTLDELLGNNKIIGLNTVVHTAFSRSENVSNIISSLEYLKKLCNFCKNTGIKRFINISSQSVYGADYELGIRENGALNPQGNYAFGKVCSEIICESVFENSEIDLINIRLSSVCENARFLKVFVDNVMNSRSIVLTAPNQTVSFIDVRDVAAALLKVINYDGECSGIYNLGSGRWCTIEHCAETVIEVALKRYGLENGKIEIVNDRCNQKVGMNVDKFKQKFDWFPEFDLTFMIKSLFEMLVCAKGGGN